MEITNEILLENGYKIQEGLSFPFNVTPLFEHPDNKVYIVDSTVQDDQGNCIWLWGVGEESDPQGEGYSVEQFNLFLSKNGFDILK